MPDIPEPLPENARTLEIWRSERDQVRIGPKGPFALDDGAVLKFLEHAHGVDDIEWELLKMKRLFYETYIKGAKNG